MMEESGGVPWQVRRGPQGVGSGLIETRLGESIGFLRDRFGVSVPKGGRHENALEVLTRWNESGESPDLSDGEVLREITEAHRLGWETFLIVLSAVEDRRNSRSPFMAEKFHEFVKGDLVDEGRDGLARNTQFELYVAAEMRLPGLSVYRGEPDLRMLYGAEEVGIAVKRVRSLNDDQVQKHSRAAASQIEAQGLRGWIAINLDSRFEVIDFDQPEASLLDDFNETLSSLHSSLRRAALKKHVLGFMLFGHVHSWRPPPDGAAEPRLHWAPPMSWRGLVDDPGEVVLFEEFTSRWAERRDIRLQTIVSPNFTGLL